MPIQEFIDIEEAVLFCQKMASCLYATCISNGWSLDEEESPLCDLSEKKRVELTLKGADVFCDFLINPPEKVQECTFNMRKAVIEDEVEYLQALIMREDATDVFDIDADDINNMMNSSSLKKRLVHRVQQTQKRIQKFSTPKPNSSSSPSSLKP